MKRGTHNNSKFRSLSRMLGVRDYVTTGILESLWHLCARETPCGDIGRISNARIASGIDWDGEAEVLIDALVECEWIDLHPEHRLVVHDWHEHADETLKKTLARHGKAFVTSAPLRRVTPSIYFIQGLDTKRIKIGFTEGSVEHRVKALQTGSAESLTLLLAYEGTRNEERHLHKTFAAASAGGEWFEPVQPLLAFVRQRQTTAADICLPVPEPVPEPEPVPVPEDTNDDFCPECEVEFNDAVASESTKPESRKSGLKRVPTDWSKHWDEFVSHYPARNGDRGIAKGREKFKAVLTSGVPPGELIEGVQRYRAWADATATSGTQFIKQIPTWLTGRSWTEAWVIPPQSHQRPFGGLQSSAPSMQDRLAYLRENAPNAG